MDMITADEKGICEMIKELEKMSDSALKLMAPTILLLSRGLVDASLHIGMEPNLRKFWSKLMKRRRKIRNVSNTVKRNNSEIASTTI